MVGLNTKTRILKGYDSGTDLSKSFEANPLDEHYVLETIVNDIDLSAAAHYYPSSEGKLVGTRKYVSVAGHMIDGAGESTVFTIQVTNSSALGTAIWTPIAFTDDTSGLTVTDITCLNTTKLVAASVNVMNYNGYRYVVTPDNITNTVILSERGKAL